MLSWLLLHWSDIFAVYGGIVAACTAIVKVTPSTRDDEFLDKVIKVVDFFSTAFTKADAEKLKKNS